MSDTHPIVIVIFFVLLSLAVWSHRHEKPKQVTPPHDDRAYRRRTDPVWKDRGTL